MSTSNKLVDLIREIVKDELLNKDDATICLVQSVNADGTLNIQLLSDIETILENIPNNSAYTFESGDYAVLYKLDNNLANAFVMSKVTDVPPELVKNTYIMGGGSSSGGGGPMPSNYVQDVTVNEISVVENKVAKLHSTASVTSGSQAFLTSGGAYTALANYAKTSDIPTSINNMSGGSLTSPLVVYGGDGANGDVAKIALDHTRFGQITDEGTRTLFGFLSNSIQTLTVGSTNYGLNLRGNTTRPQYKSSDLALYSDIPTVPTKTSDLTNDGDGDVYYTEYPGYDSFATVDDYIGYYVLVGSDYTLVTSDNKGTLSITPGTTKAYEQNDDPFATKSFVNSSIATNTAYFRGTYNIVTDLGLTTSADRQQIVAALASQMTQEGITPTNNDYCFVAYPDSTDPTQYTKYDRYKYNGSNSTWEYEYTLNNSSFTANQWAAINSGITSTNYIKKGEANDLGASTIINSNVPNSFTIKRKTNGGGAFIDYYGDNQSANGWRVGSDQNKDYAIYAITNGISSKAFSIDSSNNVSAAGFIYQNGERVANLSDIPTVNNGTLTIQKNETTVATFTADQAGNTTANIVVPVNLADLNNRDFSNITNRYQSLVSWGGNSITGGVSPIETATIDDLGGNKFAFASANTVTVQYSRDGGATWVDYGASNDDKRRLVTTSATFRIGKRSGANNIVDDQLRVILNANIAGGNVYCALKRLLLDISTEGSGGSKVKVERRLISNYLNNVDTWIDDGTTSISGWSGWNSIKVACSFGGSSDQTGQTAQIRLTFSVTSVSSSNNNLSLRKIRAIANPLWTSPSTMASTRHLYSYDINQNATFPASIILKNNTPLKGTTTGDSILGLISMASDNSMIIGDASSGADSVIAVKRTLRPSSAIGSATGVDLGTSNYKFRDLYISGKSYIPTINNGGDITVPANSGTMALVSDIPTVPTKTSDLTNDGNDGTSPFATETFVNSSVATNTAYFRGTYNIVDDLGLTTSADRQQIVSALATKMTQEGITPTNNDYCFVSYPDATDPTQFTKYDRYKYDGANLTWEYEYTLNNSSFTAAQWAAINSGVASGNWVTTNTDQEVGGVKTFTGANIVKGNVTFKDANNITKATIENSNGYITGTWLRTSNATEFNPSSASQGIAVINGGWIYYRSWSNFKDDLAYIAKSSSASQIISVTGTSGDDQETPLFLKSNNSDAYIGFKNSSGTTLGYYGVDANHKPIFYDTSAKQLALHSEIPDISGKVDKVSSANKIYGTDNSGNQTTYNKDVSATASSIAQRDTNANLNATSFSVCTSDSSTMKAKMQYNSTNESIEFIFS